jgi:ABC-type polysaccharide/polyol phosphate transport system ATPase subunit
MGARLGFAVATAWKPEILILDEILSVGDEAFQQKCRKKMEEFRDGEVTSILVTHDMQTLESLCTRAVWLDRGNIRAMGQVGEVIKTYRDG